MDESSVRTLLSTLCTLIQEQLPKINELRYEVLYKEDNTPVTKADIFIEQLVISYLQKKVKDITFICEESYSNNDLMSNDGFLAVLDPIDGTENFSSGLMEWGVSFGLWKDQEFLGGFIYMPELNLRIMSGDTIEYQKSRIIGLSSSIRKELIDEIQVNQQYRIMGCAVYNIYNVITGSYARFINPVGAYVWDFLPGVMLALEHGCKVFINGKLYNGEILEPYKRYQFEIVR
ncbi:inositol monophosphatase family protein [Lysinibacillus fusiformis]|uniref:inositol monophosphatase family protein n=1 Tax=Lysinibacillus fusiformis TaxID=28031 RepID=UPI0021BEB75D|nr:inositol monophosphatase family protein [Lysinibacillus fusiformis]UXJ69545.1 hypothetical protein N5069_03155 [Lysinibacillus fusiformis]